MVASFAEHYGESRIMEKSGPIYGVLLSETLDLRSYYNLDFANLADDVRLLKCNEVTDPRAIRFAVCWLPGREAFEPYPNLEMVMSVGAGVNDLLDHPGVRDHVAICRVRDQNQANLMAGYAVHEVLHVERGFAQMERHQAAAEWAALPMRSPEALKVAVLGNGTMGAAVARAVSMLGFSTAVACRRPPSNPTEGIEYFTGDNAITDAATDSEMVINALPLTAETVNVLNKDLFSKLVPGAWLVQIGRGEHLHEADFMAALDSGQLKGASLDVFHQEPLPPEHPFWRDKRLRISPHVASDTTPDVVAEQILQSARELLAGQPLSLAVDKTQGY